MSHRSHGSRRSPALLPLHRLLATAIAMLFTAACLVPSARARTLTGCEVDYTAQQWKTGFTATITVRNIGARLKRWRLEWHFADPGQTVIQGWNGEYVQDGTHVTVTGRPGKASLEAGASLTLGFNGSWSGANPAPTTFELNGITCTRPVPPTPTPRTAPPAPSSGDPWTPPAALAAGLDQVWRHVENTYPDLYGFRNYTWDQVMANGGSINYCVRWESDAPVSAQLRDRIHAALARQFKKWVDTLVQEGAGWNGWPYVDVPVRVVGWAVRDRDVLKWDDDSVDVYVGDIAEGAPQCAPACSRFFHQDGDYSGCPGGAERHYDMSLWVTEGMTGGAGGDWGQRIGREYLMESLASDDIHILLHEMGHGFGLDDFYDWTPAGADAFLMKAGSARHITEFDRWMLRDWWRHLKPRYGY